MIISNLVRVLSQITLITIYTGSVFLTSGKFVNATNTPKLYFVVLFVLLALLYAAIFRKRIYVYLIKNKTILWGIIAVCFAQAFYGLCQFVGWLPSNHSKFAITGSFDNPAGFATVLTMGFPLGLFLLTIVNKTKQYLLCFILAVIAGAVLVSGSRTGLLAIIISSITYFLFQANSIKKFQKLKFQKALAVSILVMFALGATVLYYKKKDSANGRLLIWKVSSEMLKDKPVFGHGYGAFQAKYMDYQAEYFRNNSDSKYSQLADNVKHPFNEFIKVAVEFGIVGLILVFALLLVVLWKLIKSKNENRGLVLSGLASFLVCASFSYPLQYISVWILLVFYLSALLPIKVINIRNTPISIIVRSIIVIVCVFFLSHFVKQIQAEIKWKTIAMSSLRGNTEKMLPEYKRLYLTSLKQTPLFLYNYGAELNVAGKFNNSINILQECQLRFNDYDLQMLLADNYRKTGNPEKAIQIYEHASDMIPCRFLPLHLLFEIYKENDQKDMAVKIAKEITDKKVKIPSGTISFIQNEAKIFLDNNK